MRRSHRTVAALLGVATVVACKPADGAGQSAPSTAPAVVIATGMSRSGGEESHYAECGHDPHARIGEYRVFIPAGLGDALSEGQPCPVGDREPMPYDEHPDLAEALQQPLAYEGGDPSAECGTWGTGDPAEARHLVAECGPLTKGELP